MRPSRMHTEASTMASAFEQRKSFIVRSTSKETGNRAHTCPPDPGFRVKFKGVGEKSNSEADWLVSNQPI